MKFIFCSLDSPFETLKYNNQPISQQAEAKLNSKFPIVTLSLNVVVTFEVRNRLKFKSSVLSSVDGAAGCN
jgi:hypothetical protein